jgi:hypothetical protein
MGVIRIDINGEVNEISNEMPEIQKPEEESPNKWEIPDLQIVEIVHETERKPAIKPRMIEDLLKIIDKGRGKVEREIGNC